MDRSSSCFMFLVVGIIFSSIEQMFPIIVWVGGWALETQRCSQTGAELGNLSPRSKAGQVSQAYGCKKDHLQIHTQPPSPPPCPRAPVHLKPPTCHPHEIVLVVPSGVLHEPMNLTGLCCSLFPLPLSLGHGPLWP